MFIYLFWDVPKNELAGCWQKRRIKKKERIKEFECKIRDRGSGWGGALLKFWAGGSGEPADWPWGGKPGWGLLECVQRTLHFGGNGVNRRGHLVHHGVLVCRVGTVAHCGGQHLCQTFKKSTLWFCPHHSILLNSHKFVVECFIFNNECIFFYSKHL